MGPAIVEVHRGRNTCTRRAAATLAALALTMAASADVIFVRGTAAGANDGTSWENAFSDLQAALAAATAGDEIWVAAGVYRPAAMGGDRNATFLLKNGVALYGGFAGNESLLSERDWTANTSTLSGDLNGDDGPDFANTTENAYQVVVALSVDDTTILDGFTIERGRADGAAFGADPASKEQGSGINVYFASPRIANCTIQHNWSLNHGAVNDHGDTTTVDNCLFRDNYSAAFGAGLYIHHHSETTATRCRFEHNFTPGDGAGAYSRSQHGAMLADCTFENNSAEKGAGMYNAPDSATHIVECLFRNNQARFGGGSYSDFAAPHFEVCLFTGNVSDYDGDRSGNTGGGGIWLAGGSPEVHTCNFYDNFANQGAGIYVAEDGLPTIMDCYFVQNTANEAGGIYNLQSPSVITGCVFTSNVVRGGTFPVGGGLSSYFASSIVTNCQFRDNEAALGGGGMYMEGGEPLVIGCAFNGNRATGVNECCGTQAWGGGVLFSYSTSGHVVNSIVTGNTAKQGGGIFALALSQPTIVNCTIAGNIASVDGGGAFAWAQSTPALRNSILWNNHPNEIVGSTFDATFCCVTGGYAGAGNISADPLFARDPAPGDDGMWGTADDDFGNLALRPHSPCIDAAENAALPAMGATDFSGAPRFADDSGTPDSGQGAAPLVDIGAYEFQGRTFAYGDMNCDGQVNNFDIDPFVLALSDPQSYAQQYPTCASENADIDGDGLVTNFDVDPFVTLLGA